MYTNTDLRHHVCINKVLLQVAVQVVCLLRCYVLRDRGLLRHVIFERENYGRNFEIQLIRYTRMYLLTICIDEEP